MKAKFKYKGFTLLELLAIIIVLGIIALIATSTVGNIVEYSKKEAFKTSVKTIIKTGENYSSVAQLNSGNKLSYPVSFSCDGKACTNGDTKLEFTGKVPVSGSIVVEDAKTVKASYISDGKYCVSGTKDDLSIGKTCGDIDTTKPTLTVSLDKNIIKITMHDKESGIDSYCVSSTVGTSTCKWNEVKGNYAEHELKKNGTYSVYAKDKKGNVSEGITFITDDIEAPELIGTLDKRTLKLVITDNGDGTESYCITTTNDSSTCKWIAVESSYVEYTFDKSDTYYAFAKDKAGNISDGLKVATGDIEDPTLSVTRNKNVLTLNYTDNVGVTAYCINVTDNSNTCSWIVTEGNTINHALYKSGTYYIFVKDTSDNTSKSVKIVTGDIEKPTITGELNNSKVTLTFKDDVGVTGYCVSKTESSESCSWTSISETSIVYKFTSAGAFYIYAKDAAGNISDYLKYEITKDLVCDYPSGQEFDFAYNKTSEEWKVPCSGLYKLEVWGAQGGGRYGGAGGYSVGYIELENNTSLFITVGGKGAYSTASRPAGGFNGGGAGATEYPSSDGGAGGGGGATHIALVTGTLKDIGKTEFVDNKKGLIVAGGGGGGAYNWAAGLSSQFGGGAGGGLSGSRGSTSSDEYTTGSPGGGGTQTSGASFGAGSGAGVGGEGYWKYVGGGGGGFYGGGGAYKSGYTNHTSGSAGGGGGSGWIGGVPEITYEGTTYSPTTTSGVNTDNGKAKITYVG